MRIPPPLAIGPLSEREVAEVRALAEAATAIDNVFPLSEQTLLNLAIDSESLTHALARNKAGLPVGYAQIDRRGDAASAEIVVHPEHRRRGTGRLLLRVATHDATLPSRSGQPGDARKGLRVWAHGDLPEARAFAASAGLLVVRELLQLERKLDTPLPERSAAIPSTPERRIRSFTDADGPDWVRLNSAAFADHPEQGRLTADDLAARQAEDWYDPRGLLILEEVGPGNPLQAARMLGYVWTKVPTGQPEASREGEIYALGVDPAVQGEGLGRALHDAGLAHLASVGVRIATLYVDRDNAAALALYERSGFTRRAVDVQYAVAQKMPR